MDGQVVPGASPSRAALVELTALEARLVELRLRVTADASDVAEETGARDVGAWSASATRRRRSDCAAELRLALALLQRPVLATALREDSVNRSRAEAIVASLDALPPGVDPLSDAVSAAASST